jgi:hypothetical protein
MTLEIQVQVWDRHKNVAVLIWLMESQCMDATGFYKSFFLTANVCHFLNSMAHIKFPLINA